MVLNNEDLNQVTWEQRVMEGNPKFEPTQTRPNVPYSRFAEMIGLEGIYVDRPDQVGPAWDRALAAGRPVVLEIKTDPEVPPLPPHITLDQARALEGFIPSESLPGAGRPLLSHDAACILNAGKADAHVEIMLYLVDREPVGPYRITIAAERTRTCASTSCPIPGRSRATPITPRC